MNPAPLIPLADGAQIPAIGLGTYPLDDAEAQISVRQAIETGYRLVDTAAGYGNERGVGRGIADSAVPRAELFITTKLRGADQGYAETLTGFEASRQRLGVDYVDLYLIHWPLPRVDKYVESWRAMIKLHDDGAVKSIGVSNFTAAYLDRLLDETGVMPVVNQIELHPYFNQEQVRQADAERGVRTESWSPLGRGSALVKEPAVIAAADAHGVSPAQVVLRWHVQLDAIPIPKSADPQRQQANLSVFAFKLSDNEMTAISALRGSRTGGDPETHEEF